MANSVDPDEMAHDEPSHLDLHFLQKNLCRSAGLKGLNLSEMINVMHNECMSLTGSFVISDTEDYFTISIFTTRWVISADDKLIYF